MPVKCGTCLKEFNNNFFLNRHANRKIPCTLAMPNHAKTMPKHSKAMPNNADNSDDVCKSEQAKHKCNYCNKSFTQSGSLNRHLNDNRCKIKKEQDIEKEVLFDKLVKELEENNKRIQKLEETVQQQSKIIKKSSKTNNGIIGNNNTINNIDNSVKIVAFGKEDISHLTNKDWLKILNRNYKSIEDLTLITHFDKNRPENQNIYISNLRSKYIMVHDGSNWVVKDRNNTVGELYDEKAYIIFNKVEELTDKLPLKIVDKFDMIKTGYDEDEIRKALLKDLDMTLYNQRRIPIMTHKLKDSNKIF